MVKATLDGKGRLSIPSEIRDRLGMEPGDVMFLDVKQNILRVAKATNPFDLLADEALEESRMGKTVGIRDFAESEGIEVEWPSDDSK